jgi:penicillin amidase
VAPKVKRKIKCRSESPYWKRKTSSSVLKNWKELIIWVMWLLQSITNGFNYLKNTFWRWALLKISRCFRTHTWSNCKTNHEWKSLCGIMLTPKRKKKQEVRLFSKKSFKRIRCSLENNLGKYSFRLTTLEHQHPLGKVAALRRSFNAGPLKFRFYNNNLFWFLLMMELHQRRSTTRRLIFRYIENTAGENDNWNHWVNIIAIRQS